MHTDEAVNAYIVGELLARKSFPYEAGDRHGPALAAFALPLVRAQGARTFSDLTETELRLTSVLAGTLTLILFGAAVELFGFLPCLIAALLYATASLPVYYDRYFIHESLFCSATFGLMLSGWRAIQRASVAKAALAGACAALMLACKETAVLHFAALAAAAMFYHWSQPSRTEAKRWSLLRLVLSGATAFLVLSVVLFTWFGSDWKVLTALPRAVPAYFARAHGAGHQKPFGYYANLLARTWSGGAVCALACAGLMLTVRKRGASPFLFLGLYIVFLGAIYSFIPYKTPWIALNFWVPLSLLAGLAVQSFFVLLLAKRDSYRIAVVPGLALFLAAALAVARDTRRLVFVHPADEDNPYAYAHTSEDLLGLVAEIDLLSRQTALQTPRIAVLAADPWPLPWYLRHYPHTGFWQPSEKAMDADFYITTMEAADQSDKQLEGFRPDFFGLRPGVIVLLWSRSPR